MFTGIVEAAGTVESFVAGRLRVRCGSLLEDAKIGASIAVNGVCLTAVELAGGAVAADIAPETLARTNLGGLKSGDLVNLERPLQAGGRLDGHIVQGHVDGTGTLVSLEPLGDGNWWIRVGVPPELERYLVYKGSVALDGISLTVAKADQGEIAVTIIPHTYAHTNLRSRSAGDRINIECDVLAKYVEKMLAARDR